MRPFPNMIATSTMPARPSAAAAAQTSSTSTAPSTTQTQTTHNQNNIIPGINRIVSDNNNNNNVTDEHHQSRSFLNAPPAEASSRRNSLPFGVNETDVGAAATVLRAGTFRDRAKRLYTYFQPQALEWPSLTVSWVPSRKQVDGFRDFSLQTVVVGTQAAEGELNYLSFIETTVPIALEDIDVMIREEDDLEDPESLDKVPYRRVRGHTRMTQFVPVDAPVLRTLYCCPNLGVDTIAVKTAATPNVLLYNCFRDRYKFSTDPKRNMPDLVLKPYCGNAGDQQRNTLSGIGFGLAASPCDEGLFAAGGDDGVLHVWKLDAERLIDPPEYQALHEQQKEKVQRRNELRKQQQQQQQQQMMMMNNNNNNNPDPISNRISSSTPVAPTLNETVPPRPTTVLFSTSRFPGGHKQEITDVSCHSTQSHLIVTSSASGHCCLWDLRVKHGAVSGGDVLRHNGGVNTIAFHPTAAFQVATGGQDGIVKLWDIRSWKEVEVGAYSYHNKPVLRVNWAPFNDCVFGSSGEDGLVCIWDLNRGVETKSDKGEQGVPKELAFVHAGHVSTVPDFDWCPNLNDEYSIASVDHTNLLQMWRPNSGAVSGGVKADAFDEDNLE